jgi:hypothetical protein
LKDGTQSERFRARPRGSAIDPLSSSELDAKFQACSAYAGYEKGPELLSKLRRVNELDSMRFLLEKTSDAAYVRATGAM